MTQGGLGFLTYTIDVLKSDRSTLTTLFSEANTRHSCVRVMKMAENEHPLFTIEQKYILLHTDGSTIGRRLPEGNSWLYRSQLLVKYCEGVFVASSP